MTPDQVKPLAQADLPSAEAPASVEVVAEKPTTDKKPLPSSSQAGRGGRRQGRHHEDAELVSLVNAWVTKIWPEDAIKKTFIETEVDARLRSYRKQAVWWRTAQISIWLLLAVLGLLISVFAGFQTGHGFTIIAGALVATLSTLTNAVHPSKQADGYLNARLALREEGWDLLNGTGGYADLTDDTSRYLHFDSAVDAIVKTKRASTSLDALS